METLQTGALFGRNDFLLRRLHSLTGLVPVGAYMVVHLATNATVIDGARSFQSRVDMIHSLGWFLPFVEWTFIFLPLLFHAFFGVILIRSGQQNVSNYPYQGNVRYFLQRLTAWIALAFIFWHVFEMHGWIKPAAEQFGGARFRHLYATSSAAGVIQSSPVLEVFYLVGVLACVYHLANGTWTAGITWGLWSTAAAQRRANWVCLAIGVLVAGLGLSALVGIKRVNVEQAFQVEQQINAQKVASGEITQHEADEIPDLPQLKAQNGDESQAEQAASATQRDES